MRVEFTIPETDVEAKCECGHVCRGDSAVDAFMAWWKHKTEVHGSRAEET